MSAHTNYLINCKRSFKRGTPVHWWPFQAVSHYLEPFDSPALSKSEARIISPFFAASTTSAAFISLNATKSISTNTSGAFLRSSLTSDQWSFNPVRSGLDEARIIGS